MKAEYGIVLPDGFSDACVSGWEELGWILARILSRSLTRSGPENTLRVRTVRPFASVPVSAFGKPRPDAIELRAWKGTRLLVPVLPDTSRFEEILRSDWSVLRRAAAEGTLIAGACAGVFAIAESGLLDGKEATTHWSLVRSFRSRYPRVRLRAELMVVDSGGISTAAGMSAWIDLFIHLAASDFGSAAAGELGRLYLHDPGRTRQAPYADPRAAGGGEDGPLARAEAWLEENFRKPLSVESWAAAEGLTLRTFQRLARREWGATPIGYAQRRRLDEARILLESTRLPFSEIAFRCGYVDAPTFARLFASRFGLAPGEYRRRYESRAGN